MTSLHRIQFPVHTEKLSVEYIKFLQITSIVMQIMKYKDTL